MQEMEQKAKKIAELLKVMANENRLLILCLLIKKEMTVSELIMKIPHITQSAISQHLANLKAHGILGSKKSAQNVTYFIADERVTAIIDSLKEQYCQ